MTRQSKPAIAFGLAALSLAGCELAEPVLGARDAAPVAAATVVTAPPPAADARTVEDFDTTTAEQRAAAVAAEPSGATALLGSTVVSLGDPARPGFWIETSLVDAPRPGFLENPETGKSVEVEMLPSGGGGSRVSLAAMRLLGAPLTGLPTMNLYVR